MTLSLGLDTSGPWCGVAVVLGGQSLAAQHAAMQKGQAEHLMPMIGAALAEAHVSLHDLDCIGVGIGPGNFTGVRISVSAARGLALALAIFAAGRRRQVDGEAASPPPTELDDYERRLLAELNGEDA